MFAVLSAASSRASRSKRDIRSESAAKAAGSTFRATSRPSLVSWARYTSPIPPAPRGERILYGPICEPADSRILNSQALEGREHYKLPRSASILPQLRSAAVEAETHTRPREDRAESGPATASSAARGRKAVR